jgi:hypothetical protein
MGMMRCPMHRLYDGVRNFASVEMSLEDAPRGHRKRQQHPQKSLQKSRKLYLLMQALQSSGK